MKKNLLLLFTVYFFVVQPLIASLLWSDLWFLYLALINLFCVVVISSLYAHFERTTTKHEHSDHPWSKKFPKRTSFGGLIVLVIVSIFLAGLGIFLLQGFLIPLRLFLGSIVWFLIYFVIYALSSLREHFQFFKLVFTHLYLLLIVASAGFLGINLYQHVDQIKSFDTLYPLLLVQETQSVIETGQTVIVDNTISGFVDSSIVEQTGTVIDMWTSDTSISTGDDSLTSSQVIEAITKTGRVTMMDAVIYLLDTNKITLSSLTTVKFIYVSTKNPYYSYFKTAYDLKLLGKNANPSKNILCETYEVMKGLVKGRDVAAWSNIKLNYWNAAKAKNELHGCIWGTYVKVENL